MTTLDALRIFAPAVISFLIGMAMTPFVTHFLYKHRMWKPKAGKIALDGTTATVFNQLHGTREVGTPRFGGVIVWGSVLLSALLLEVLVMLIPDVFTDLAFLSRNQTWVPLAALLVGSLVGLIDDLFEVRGKGGLRLRVRLLVVATVSIACAFWFYSKLDVSSITVPFLSTPLELGIFFIPFFLLVTLFLYAGGVIDGIDGLGGGVFAIIFGAYGALAFFQNQMDIAGFCAAVTGGLLAFLWFNIPPARFYLSETGTMGLTIALTVVAFLTDVRTGGQGLTVLPLIALPLVLTVASVVIQIAGKKILKRKIFRVAPLHHHFEALGWPPYKVTMRYWIVGVVGAITGLAIALL